MVRIMTSGKHDDETKTFHQLISLFCPLGASSRQIIDARRCC
jgi:hypothetical protein